LRLRVVVVYMEREEEEVERFVFATVGFDSVPLQPVVEIVVLSSVVDPWSCHPLFSAREGCRYEQKGSCFGAQPEQLSILPDEPLRKVPDRPYCQISYQYTAFVFVDS
jgi:hypothetical protein